MTRLCYSDISTIDPEYFESVMANVPADRTARAKRVMNADMRRCILASYVLCKRMLSDAGVASFDFDLDEYGKPILVPFCGIHFNLSYSGTIVSCCIADSEIGVDVERIGRIELSVARRFFHRNEYDEIIGCDNPDMAAARLWTIKESLAKNIGSGISREFLGHSFGGFSNTMFHSLFFCDYEYYINEYFLEDYCISVCNRKHEFPEKIERIDLARI